MVDSLNFNLFRWIHDGAGSRPALDLLAVMAAEGAPYIVVVLLAVFWLTTNRRRRPAILEAALAVAVGLLINQGIAFFYFHPRPFMIGLCHPLISHAPETSFPSDHATLLFAAALSLLLRRRWRQQGIVLLAFALAGSWGRVYTGLHFPFDIAGSLLVAVVSVALLMVFRTRLTPLYDRVVRMLDIFPNRRVV